MFRKSIFAIAAIGTIAAAALVPTSASAYYKGKSHWYGHGWAPGITIYSGYGYNYRYAPRCWLEKRWFKTYYGPRVKYVEICTR